MNIKQQNRFTRLKKVRKVFKLHEAEWLNKPTLVNAIEKLDAEISFLENAQQITIAGTKHITSGKVERHSELVDQLVWLSGVLQSYAVKYDDKDLKAETKLTPSRVKKLRKESFIGLFQYLVKRATNLGASCLSEFEVDDIILDEFVTIAADLERQLGKPQFTSLELQTLREEIPVRLRVVAEMLRYPIFSLMHPFKTKNTSFWIAFKKSMTIIDRRSSHGSTDDEVTGLDGQ
jgi:hypothetical protein